MNLKWWRLETVKKHGPAFSEEADNNSKRDVEKRCAGIDNAGLMKIVSEHGPLR